MRTNDHRSLTSTAPLNLQIKHLYASLNANPALDAFITPTGFRPSWDLFGVIIDGWLELTSESDVERQAREMGELFKDVMKAGGVVVGLDKGGFVKVRGIGKEGRGRARGMGFDEMGFWVGGCGGGCPCAHGGR